MNNEIISTAAAVVVFIIMRKKYKKRRRFWVRPSLQYRKWQNGTVMIENFKKDDVGCQQLRNSMFFGFLRMSYEDFEFLLQSTEVYISKKNTGWREAIPAKERLAVTLRFLATGENYFSLGELFKISPQLLSSLIPEVCVALISKLQITVNIIIKTITCEQIICLTRMYVILFEHFVQAHNAKFRVYVYLLQLVFIYFFF